MRKGLGCLLLALMGLSMATAAQDAVLTLWTFPEPDRGPNDLAISEDGRIYLTFFDAMAIGRFDPSDDTLVEWALDSSPDSLVLTELGVFYTLPLWKSLGFLEPEQTYTLEWRTPAADPRRLVIADSGSGIVNLYVAERAVGRIAAFEPTSIAFRSLAGVDRIPVLLDAKTMTISPNGQVATRSAFPAPDNWTPTAVELSQSGEAPFREWSVDLGGMDPYIDDIALGGDGGIWYVQGMAPALGVLIPWDDFGAVYPLPSGTDAAAVAAAPDESIWFADIVGPRHIGQLDPETGDVVQWAVPLDCLQPYAFVFQEDLVWFSDREADAIFCLDPETSLVRRWSLPQGTSPLTLKIDEEGALWFVSEGLNAVGRLAVGELDGGS